MAEFLTRLLRCKTFFPRVLLIWNAELETA